MEIRFQMIEPHLLPQINKKVLVLLKRNEDDILIARRVGEDSWLAVDDSSYPDYINFNTDDLHAWGFLESREDY